mgnify:CR=1 FL=1
MIAQLGHAARKYGGMAAIVPKMFLAYSIWVWMSLFVEIIAVVIFVAFWRAVYASTTTVGGLTLDQTLNYILLARIFYIGAGVSNVIYDIGVGMREGQIAVVLLRPLDYQIPQLATALQVRSIFAAVALFIWLVYGLTLPSDPVVWPAFLFTLILGHAVLFCFDWIIGCAAFYSTEIWGMSVVRYSVALFFSGALIPLTMMPDWLRNIALILPFSQVVYLPVSLLSGITPVSDMPRIWLIQSVMLVALLFLSRFVFGRAVRVVTVQGG